MMTVFDLAQSRLRAVEVTDRILARQQEQKAELEALRSEQRAILLNGATDLHATIKQYEGELIRAALRASDKSVARAARLLNVSYQWLTYTIESRHKELLSERTAVVRRKKSL